MQRNGKRQPYPKLGMCGAIGVRYDSQSAFREYPCCQTDPRRPDIPISPPVAILARESYNGVESSSKPGKMAPQPDNLLVLFPEFSTATNRDRRRCDVVQTELATPPFRAGSPWISARRNAWLSAAVQDPPRNIGEHDQGMALLSELARHRVGGTFWADAAPLPRTVDVLICLPDDPITGLRLTQTVLARHDAARIAVLCRDRRTADRLTQLGCTPLIGPCDPWALFDRVDEVHCHGDNANMLLALAAGKRVVCHAPAAFAGWGVTIDEPTVPRRGTRTLGDLATAALVRAARHADPFRQRPCVAHDAIELLVEWRRLTSATHGVACVFGIAWWKQREVMALLRPGKALAVTNTVGSAVSGARSQHGAVLAWSSQINAGLRCQANAADVPVWQVEDGFVRSVGLGANSMPPYSLVVDRRGIYFDPGHPSDLEHILQHSDFPSTLLARAGKLREQLVRQRVSKYNTGGATVPPRRAKAGQQIVLVPGQVSDDRSFQLGGAGVQDNAALLAAVREAMPEAWLIYKPHPDVHAGQRAGALRDKQVLQFADELVRDVAMPSLLEHVDEVHVLTSLTGFEALLRGKRVVVWGQPFYAGWGLTQDKAPVARRTRSLTIDELVAGTLLRYAHYLDPVTRLPCPVEVLLERLEDPSLWTPGARIGVRKAYGTFRRLIGLR